MLFSLSADTPSAAQDLYKMAHQSHLGPGHAVSTMGEALRRLEQEAANLDLSFSPDAAEREALLTGSPYLRLHLRPYLLRGGRLDDLARIFYESAALLPPLQPFAEFLSMLTPEVLLRLNSVQCEEWLRLVALVEHGHIPVLHHSDAYKEAFCPAYRVVSQAVLESAPPRP